MKLLAQRVQGLRHAGAHARREVAAGQRRAPRAGVGVEADPVDRGRETPAADPADRAPERLWIPPALVAGAEADAQRRRAAAARLLLRRDHALRKRLDDAGVRAVRRPWRVPRVRLVGHLERDDAAVAADLVDDMAHIGDEAAARLRPVGDARPVREDELGEEALAGRRGEALPHARVERLVVRAVESRVAAHDEGPVPAPQVLQRAQPRGRVVGARRARRADRADPRIGVDAEHERCRRARHHDGHDPCGEQDRGADACGDEPADARLPDGDRRPRVLARDDPVRARQGHARCERPPLPTCADTTSTHASPIRRCTFTQPSAGFGDTRPRSSARAFSDDAAPWARCRRRSSSDPGPAAGASSARGPRSSTSGSSRPTCHNRPKPRSQLRSRDFLVPPVPTIVASTTRGEAPRCVTRIDRNEPVMSDPSLRLTVEADHRYGPQRCRGDTSS